MKPGRSSLLGIRASLPPDDVSVSESICSDVLDQDPPGGGLGPSVRGVGGSGRPDGSTGYDRNDSPDGIEDPPSVYVGRGSGASGASHHSLGDSSGSKSDGDPAVEVVDADAPRGARKSALHRAASERPAGSSREWRQVKKRCSLLERRLAETTERMKEADFRAASRIDSLESELRVAERGAGEAADQSGAIRTLGKKLIRQAYVIKKQKEAADQYKIRLGAMEEEMAMQDERDSQKEEECAKLQERYDALYEQKIEMENLLQENAEEIADLKTQAAEKIMELELSLQKKEATFDRATEFLKSQAEQNAKRITRQDLKLKQKDATLDRVTKEGSDKSLKILELEAELEGKNRQVESMEEKLKEGQSTVDDVKRDLKNATAKMEELRREHSLRKAMDGTGVEGGGVDEGDARRQPAFMSWIQEVGEVTGLKTLELERKLKQKEAALDKVTKEGSDKSSKIAELEAELEEKNSQVESMEEKVKEELLLVEDVKKDLASANAEVEELRREHSSPKTAEGTSVEGRGGGEGDARRQPVFMSWIQGGNKVTGLKAAEEEAQATAEGEGGGEGDARRQPLFMSWIQGTGEMAGLKTLEEESEAAVDGEGSGARRNKVDRRQPAYMSWIPGGNKVAGLEILEADSHAEESTIQTLDETVNETFKEQEETIKALRSEMVKMSSTYKQDSYLKRKEIAQLKQKNAECALKLRGLEKALKSVNVTHNRGGAAGFNSCQPRMERRMSRSLHSMNPIDSKGDMEAAVKARLGGLAPYEFPSMDRPQLKDSQIVVASNFMGSGFFDQDDERSEEGRKGEFPEEC